MKRSTGLFSALERAFEFSAKHGLPAEQALELREKLVPELYELLFVEAMPRRDAVDLARYLVETTIGFVKYSISRPKTVVGPIQIAAITKHEGFQWIQHGHSLIHT